MNLNELKPRDIIQQRVIKGLLGPGSDRYGLPDEEEITSDSPLQRYFTGILFPEKDIIEKKSPEKIDEEELQAETEDYDPDQKPIQESVNNEEETDVGQDAKKDAGERIEKEDDDFKINPNQFFPNNMGLTVCLDPSAREIEVEFTFGLYYKPVQTEVKIQAPQSAYQALIDPQNHFPLRHLLKYENGFLSLTRELEGGKKKRTGDYEIYDEFKKKQKRGDLKEHISYFDKLIGWTWKRIPIKITETINLEPESEDNKFHKLALPTENIHPELKVGYYVKPMPFDNKKYVKVLLVNGSERHLLKNFHKKSEKLNQKCIFQVNIKISTQQLRPYKSYHARHPFDDEAEILNFQYKDVLDYGIGHNCAVTWNKEHTVVETTFAPEYEVQGMKNKIKDEFKNPGEYESLDTVLKLKNLSVFGLKKETVLYHLHKFIGLYGNWISDQEQLNEKNSQKERKIGEKILKQLKANLERLNTNLRLLNDERVFKAFQYAHTAMLLQFIISREENFAGKEKHLSELLTMDYQDLNYFRDYEKHIFEYRPFQLAFFILSLDGIIEPRSKSRNKTVDLIWFPTGGGKTEAYLAVAAFTIIWRRLNNDAHFGGTSVIMRYTLRLLTSQQFERASRLIAALEFLRRHFVEDLNKEPISIGLWIGAGATPNRIEDAKDKIKKIEEECYKTEGDPEKHNVFQMSSCPWCGTRLIAKMKDNRGWNHGFEEPNKGIYIRCLNPACPFSDKIPVQVVDDMLYREPPTLLFATIDKFAMLAHREEGHRFFNSQETTGLPPDLIIQDELHLISGPLGSITGLFEGIIELLASRDGKCPKIIASTATTRNTGVQVRQLYGGREVNVFPPAGLSYRDSFFARVSGEEKKRKYIGVMPTGKTGVDTQLQILAHLLTARLEVYEQTPEEYTDKYWTIVSYYNSLKEVGRTANKIEDEIRHYTSLLQIRLFGDKFEQTFNYFGLPGRIRELTSRIESSKIKSILNEIEEHFYDHKIQITDRGNTYLKDVVDLILATNMISVGIDVARLNVMLINGMPKNVAEYIQASSRIGRESEGLAVTLFDPNRARDKSYFEHFLPFHQSFYKNIEPLSLTPFTENTIDKMLTTMMIAFVRHKIPGMASGNAAGKFKPEMLESLKQFIKERFPDGKDEYEFFVRKLNDLANDWESLIRDKPKRYDEMIKKPGKSQEDKTWEIIQSMRDVDSDTFIEIKADFH